MAIKKHNKDATTVRDRTHLKNGEILERSDAKIVRESVAHATKELSRAHARNERTRRKIDQVQNKTDQVLSRIGAQH